MLYFKFPLFISISSLFLWTNLCLTHQTNVHWSKTQRTTSEFRSTLLSLELLFYTKFNNHRDRNISEKVKLFNFSQISTPARAGNSPEDAAAAAMLHRVQLFDLVLYWHVLFSGCKEVLLPDIQEKISCVAVYVVRMRTSSETAGIYANLLF